jgi:polyisoprenoid-binding protein YceI
MRLPSLIALPLLLIATACSEPVRGGDWQLDGAASRLSFVSIKSGDIAEVHTFTRLSGSVSEGGAAELVIDLDSVETGIDIRNERMREHLFRTDQHPQARLVAQIDLFPLIGLAPGERVEQAIEGELSLNGVVLPIEADLVITDLNGREVLVQTRGPVLLHADDFRLTPGLETLRELAGLPSISPAVPVTASLVFVRNEAN